MVLGLILYEVSVVGGGVNVFLVRYSIGTPLLVIIHIPRTQKWADGYNPPLRFGRRTERRNVYK